jgi:hypothetical protein
LTGRRETGLGFTLPEEERERASKSLRLNGDISPDYDLRLLVASSRKNKPTVRIKRIGSGKLKGASSIQKDSEMAEKALAKRSYFG